MTREKDVRPNKRLAEDAKRRIFVVRSKATLEEPWAKEAIEQGDLFVVVPVPGRTSWWWRLKRWLGLTNDAKAQRKLEQTTKQILDEHGVTARTDLDEDN